jgi:hypothetical protein
MQILEQKDGRTDGRTDMKKLIVAFRNVANVLNISSLELQVDAYWSSKKKNTLHVFEERKIENN